VKRFTLYWSSIDRYEKCPKMFLLYRGWGTLDQGRGPGKGAPIPVKRSEHHKLMGIVIQAVVEDLYNDELWKHPQGLQKRLREMTDKAFDLWVPRVFFDNWSPPMEELLEVCHNGVQNFLKTMKHNRLLGPYAKAEVDLVAYVNKWTPIGGRVDTIIRREDTGITIIDGKNSQSKGKYTDPDQLRWYALCFYLAYNKMPDNLGFVYYRYPYGTPLLDDQKNPQQDEDGNPKIDEGVTWVPFTRDDLKGLGERAVKALKGMDKERFDATPVPSVCRWCDYETICPERQASKRRRRKKPSEVTDLVDGSDGAVTFGFFKGKNGTPGE